MGLLRLGHERGLKPLLERNRVLEADGTAADRTVQCFLLNDHGEVRCALACTFHVSREAVSGFIGQPLHTHEFVERCQDHGLDILRILARKRHQHTYELTTRAQWKIRCPCDKRPPLQHADCTPLSPYISTIFASEM